MATSEPGDRERGAARVAAVVNFVDVRYSVRRFIPRIPLHALIIGLMVLWSIPTLALLVSSFREPTAIAASGWWNALFHWSELTLNNYERVLEQRGMAQSFVNSVVITVPSTLLVILVAAFAGYAFAWMRFPFRNALFLVVVAMLVVPLQMTLIPVLRLYAVTLPDMWEFFTGQEQFPDLPSVTIPILGDIRLGGGKVFGVSSFPGLWLAHTAYGLPFAVFLLRSFFGALPRDLFESAYLDGASDLGVFFRIVLPLSGPAIAALAIFQFLWVWQDLLVALVLLGDPKLAPMTLTITSLVSSFGSQYQLLTAAAFISILVPLFLFFALQRYFVQGILAGAVKG